MAVKAQPIPKAGEPSDIAALAAFLASDGAQWLSGLAIPVDGGGMAGKLESQSGIPTNLCQQFHRQPSA